ncbi:hypothetical protein [Leisingera sp. M523]|uniref:hypothetical protein n=1 Tax=Leisingera sp. M523 TaxID=2867013 RepID=UPI0021A61847|nr:hypothetical protein [Leisingera sp. M523]UWQ30264.1 hypothetical protein K3557_06925 [Leisingera sp. M523]
MSKVFNGLSVRMVAYFIFAAVAGQGIAIFDPVAGTLTFHIDQMETLLSGVAGYVATFGIGRLAKARGGSS